MGADARDLVAAPLVCEVRANPVNVFCLEVHVDVGHVGAAGLHEPLEEQVVTDRVDVDDFQQVREHRAGGGSATRSDVDAVDLRKSGQVAVFAGPHDQVPHDEEVGQEPLVLDNAQLEVEASPDIGGQVGGNVGALGAFRPPDRDEVLGEVPLGGETVGQGEDGETVHGGGEDVILEHRCDRNGVGARGLPPLGGAERPHLRFGPQVEAFTMELEPFRVRQRLLAAVGEPRCVHVAVGFLGVVGVVGGDHRQVVLHSEVVQRT